MLLTYVQEIRTHSSQLCERNKMLSQVAKTSKKKVDEERKKMLSEKRLRAKQIKMKQIDNEETIQIRKVSHMMQNKEKAKKVQA